MRRIIFFLGWCLVPCVAFSQNQITQILFLPSHYYVGDKVDLRIEMMVPETIKVLSEPIMSSAPWLTVHSLEVLREKEKLFLSLKFTPFETGNKTLPPINLGSIILSEIRIYTSSLLEEGRGVLSEMKPQMLLPGTLFWVGIALVLLALAPFVFFKTYTFTYYLTSKITYRWKLRKPFHEAMKQIKQIKKNSSHWPHDVFYSQLTHCIKTYLSSRFEKNCLSSTTKETENLYSGLPQIDPGIFHVLEFADLVKFAREPTGRETCENHLRATVISFYAIEARPFKHVRV